LRVRDEFERIFDISGGKDATTSHMQRGVQLEGNEGLIFDDEQ
jgi:ribosomal protein S6E (S10)